MAGENAVTPELKELGALPCFLFGSDMPRALRNLRRPDVDPVAYVSEVAAEGLTLPGRLLRQVGSTPSELVHSIRALHDDEGLNRGCREAGLA